MMSPKEIIGAMLEGKKILVCIVDPKSIPEFLDLIVKAGEEMFEPGEFQIGGALDEEEGWLTAGCVAPGGIEIQDMTLFIEEQMGRSFPDLTEPDYFFYWHSSI